MSIKEQINEVLNQLPQHQNDLNWLSSCAVQLSVLLYNLGDEVAEAELVENNVVVGHLDQLPSEGERRMSVAEAEKRGITESLNSYGRLKLSYQSLVEIIQSIKKKVDSATSQFKAGV